MHWKSSYLQVHAHSTRWRFIHQTKQQQQQKGSTKYTVQKPGDLPPGVQAAYQPEAPGID